ncbi:hypothetical protein C4J92_3134 [Pseudomonas sp. R3-18-08]|jgi:hypothetical protein|nr:hypothetical protein C4J92_3134 [Pseudomonas sp. R3-18-08]AZF27306.1 hypothetical protein C4J90_3135 [Pseudomonas sp. R2-60-08W]
MREAQRRLTLTAWRELSALGGNRMDAEVKYFELLRRADAMERADLISSDEWRSLVKHAGALLCSTAQCMGGPG